MKTINNGGMEIWSNFSINSGARNRVKILERMIMGYIAFWSLGVSLL